MLKLYQVDEDDGQKQNLWQVFKEATRPELLCSTEY